MRPFIRKLIAIASFSISSVATAQFFDSNTNHSSAVAPPAATASPEDFKNLVNSLHQQNQDTLNQQMGQKFPKPLPSPPIIPSSSLPSLPADTPVSAPAAHARTPSPPLPSAPPAIIAKPPAVTGPVISTPDSSSVIPPTPAGSQVYTGFGTDNTKNNNLNSATETSNGTNGSSSWNIKY